jgi:acetyl esterase/lipase
MTSRLFRVFSIIVLPMLCSCQSVFFGVLNAGRTAVPAVTRIYAPERNLKLDIYIPASHPAHAPVAVFFYGGSWRDGSRTQYAFVGTALAGAGILTLIVDYRTYPEVRFPGFEVDAASAVRWARDHVGEYGGDPSRMFLVGHSAGAQIVALLATDAHYLAAEGMKPRDLAGVVGIAGPYDFLPLTDPKLIDVFGPESEWPASQPVNFVDGDEPPFLLLQGQRDRVVAPRNSEAMERKLRAAQVPVTLKRYSGVGHFRILAGFRYPRVAPTLHDAAAFITGIGGGGVDSKK